MEEGMKKSGKDHGTTFNHNSLASGSQEREDDGIATGRNSDPIPLDLTIDILARLPAKSLVRFLCVSKLWSSIIRRPDFINLFFTRSSTRPRLLIIFDDGKTIDNFFFSSPHPKDPREESSSVANHDLTIPAGFFMASLSLRGLVCLENRHEVRICNPCTRQLVTLPKSKSEIPFKYYTVKNYFGYDAIDDQFKVLCVACHVDYDDNIKLISEHQVFVLGAGHSWRRIECSASHYPIGRGICIDGVLYYAAWDHGDDVEPHTCSVVSFDVRSEKFNLIKAPDGARNFLIHDEALINYHGKLAAVDGLRAIITGSIDLWVLEDAKKEEWLKRTCLLYPAWRDDALYFPQCAIHTGEIIVSSFCLPNSPLVVLYYDLKRNSIRRAEIEGILDDEFKRRNRLGNDFVASFIFSDHVESIMFLEDFSSPDR